eukprot:TRINITY_DN2280_c0_g1_i5.p1 TRINITY_DN2280_c0_g1~~TRINITY_DN2280_c0_g1_i5.p1  ORF type:complete len:309 (-),score=79.19 TRINITY_DN2280_c0_g1_i5:59-985(-)
MFEEEDETLNLDDDLIEGDSGVNLSSTVDERGNIGTDPRTYLRSCFKIPDSPLKSRKRKFPGPAGVILENSIHKSPESRAAIGKRTEVLSIDKTDSDLFGDLWRKMLEDYESSEEEIRPFTIAGLKKESLPGSSKKTPILFVVLRSIDPSSPDPSCVLSDPSGSINGMIHRDVMEQYRSHLSSGSVLALRNVAILMTLRNHYVNVTLNNLLSLYSASVNPHRLLISKGSPSNVSGLLDESKSQLKELKEDLVKEKDGNPFLKPRGSPKNFQFKKPQGGALSKGGIPPSCSNEGELLDGLDEDSLFGDF